MLPSGMPVEARLTTAAGAREPQAKQRQFPARASHQSTLRAGDVVPDLHRSAASSRARRATVQRPERATRGGQVAFLADAFGSAAFWFSAARRSSQIAFLRARRRRSRRRARGSCGVDMARST